MIQFLTKQYYEEKIKRVGKGREILCWIIRDLGKKNQTYCGTQFRQSH